jgi:tetratricopeptide (TPR) repeat protein
MTSGTAALIGRRLHADFNGLPKPSMEQLQALIDAEWLIRRENGTIKPNISLDKIRKGVLPLPADIQREVLGRLNMLDTVERNLLELLSVLDGEASTDLLSEMSRFRRVALEKLNRTDVVSTRMEGLHEIVSINSSQLKQFTYDSLSQDHKTTLHREVAAGLLAHNPRRVSSIAEAVADHLLLAGDPSQAWPLLVKAARRSARKNEHFTVKTLCERALKAAGEADAEKNNTDLYLPKAMLGNSLVAIGSYAAGRKLLEDVLGGKNELKPAILEACSSALGLALIELGELEGGAKIIRAHLDKIEMGSPSRPRSIRAYGRCLRLQNQHSESIVIFKQGLRLAQAQKSKTQEALCLLGIGKTLLATDNIEEAPEHLQHAERLLREAAGTAWAESLVQLGELDFIDGRWRQALLKSEEASIIAQSAEDLDISARAIDLCSRSLFAVGMIRDSARLHDESIGIFRALEAESTLKVQVNSPMVHATNRALNDAILLKEKGEKQAAAKLLHAKLSDLPKVGARGLRLSVLVALATVDNSFRQQAANLIEELAAALPMELKRSFRNRSDISVLTALKTE